MHLKIDDLVEAKRIELVHKKQKLAIDKYRIHHTTIQTAPKHIMDQYCRYCNLIIEGRDSDAS